MVAVLSNSRLSRRVAVLAVVVIFYGVVDSSIIKVDIVDPEGDPALARLRQPFQITCSAVNKNISHSVEWLYLPGDGEIADHRCSACTKISDNLTPIDALRHSIEQPAGSVQEYRLLIKDAQPIDQGLYMCRVRIGDSSFIAKTKRVIVIELPIISELTTSSNKDVDEGEKLELFCSAQGRPIPLVRWERLDGGRLTSGGQVTLNSNGKLVIDNVVPDARGQYKCVAENAYGSDTRHITVGVRFNPVVNVRIPVVYQAVGYIQDLFCEIEADPEVQRDEAWFQHNNKKVSHGGRHEVTFDQNSNKKVTLRLRIHGVEEDDYGSYLCIALKRANKPVRKSLRLEKSDYPVKLAAVESVRATAPSLSSWTLLSTLLLTGVFRCLF